MPAITRSGDKCTGHSCFPSRRCSTGSPNVFVNNIPVHRQRDLWPVHCCTHSDCPHGCHAGSLAKGSSSVYVNGRQLARKGDKINCGSFTAEGSPNVFAGG
ncbi:MAG: PAAR domain-containing protein [Synergistaceae bacterium]|nr:PAAR domain-containing protein [Synergistaceae bacterium]